MPFTATTALLIAGTAAAGAVAYEEVRKAKSKAATATRQAQAARLAPTPMLADLAPPTAPASSPASRTLVEIEPGVAAERIRRRRARSRSRTIFSRGLLFDEPSIYQPKLGGATGMLGG